MYLVPLLSRLSAVCLCPLSLIAPIGDYFYDLSRLLKKFHGVATIGKFRYCLQLCFFVGFSVLTGFLRQGVHFFFLK